MNTERKQYICIDLKSFYASVECVERGLDPLTTNLVVADETRTDKTICLAVSPSMKALGISGRARLFEVKQRVQEIKRTQNNDVHYIIARPRMQMYVNYSAAIYGVYLSYIAPEDIHIYSIDEVFIDVSRYLSLYKMTAHELAVQMIRDVLSTTGITATVGIGTNLYLAKIAMDIVAKHVPPDKDGVRVAELDEISFREKLWDHEPLTDFWMIAGGTTERLLKCGIHTMGELARFSMTGEDYLYRIFGVDAEILIDHAWGIEPCTMEHIKRYKTATESITSGQVLKCGYTYDQTRIVIREMTEEVIHRLIDSDMVAGGLVLHVGYEAVTDEYHGATKVNYFGKKVPVSAHGTAKLENPTSAPSVIMDAVMELFDRIVDRRLLSRRLSVTAIRVVPKSSVSYQMGFFSDFEEETKETALVKTEMDLQKRFGKNAMFKACDLLAGATKLERNLQIGGHRA